MIKHFDDALFTNADILFFDEDSGKVTFLCDEMGILSVYINNIILDNLNFFEVFLGFFLFFLLSI